LTNTGLSQGSVAQFLAPLVAGMVSAIEQCGVKEQMQDFATKKAVNVINSHSDNLNKQGERCCCRVPLLCLCKALADIATVYHPLERMHLDFCSQCIDMLLCSVSIFRLIRFLSPKHILCGLLPSRAPDELSIATW
jgi:hypothetical protein